MGYITIDFGQVCGSSNNVVKLSYDSGLNRIVVNGCISYANVSGDENYLTVIDASLVDTSSCENAKFTMQGYAASNFASLGNTGKYYDYSVNTTKSISFYKSYIRNRALQLYYFGSSNYPVDCNAGSVRTLTVDNSVPDEPTVPTFTASQVCNTTLNNEITITSPDNTDVWEYRIYRATSSTGTYSLIDSIDPSSPYTYVDENVSQEYWYKVQAYNPIFQTYSADVKTPSLTLEAPIISNYGKIVELPDVFGLSGETNSTTCSGVTKQNWYVDDILEASYNPSTGNTFSLTGLTLNQTYKLNSSFSVQSGLETELSTSVYITANANEEIFSGFTENGDMVIPSGYTYIDYFIVAGGGGGGYALGTDLEQAAHGGGGGAGGILTGRTTPPISGGTFSVIVGTGGGGGGGIHPVSSSNGGDSSFFGITAIGGGAGGSGDFSSFEQPENGFDGGSGGGGGDLQYYDLHGTGGTGIVGQGHDGADGDRIHQTRTESGGGGGASAAASNMNGGAGIEIEFNNTIIMCCEGGDGQYTSDDVVPDAATTKGSGGDGASRRTSGTYAGGSGADGIVYIKAVKVPDPVPVSPTGLTSTSITCTGATISWTNNNISGVTGNYIQIYSGDTWINIDDISSGNTTYNLINLIPNTNYKYRIVAYNLTYNIPSDEIDFTTLDPAPFNLNYTINFNNVEVNWDINDPPYGTGIRPEYRKTGASTWLTDTNIAHDATGYTFINLDYETQYEARFVRIGSEYESETITFTTGSFPEPINLNVLDNYPTLAQLSWTNQTTYDELYLIIDGNTVEITTPTDETYWYDELSPNTTYSFYLKAVLDGATGYSLTYLFTTERLSDFCAGDNYDTINTSCAGSDGKITINYDYNNLYNFIVYDTDGNSYSNNIITPDYSEVTGLTAGWYHISAEPNSLGVSLRLTDCLKKWVAIETTGSTVSISNKKERPIQCGPFDRQAGRVSWTINGSSSTYNLYIYTDKKPTEITYSDTNITDDIAAYKNIYVKDFFYGKLVSNSDGCVYLIDRFTVEIRNIASISGIKNLFITPWSRDLDYNYWKTSDEDFYLESEDSSFFFSTKIKEYFSASGGTLSWYKVPITGTMSVSQGLQKVRQGITLTDTLTIDVPKGTIEKYNDLTELLPNKWTYVIEDNMGQWWTGGYAVGSTIETYTFETGDRGGENKYSLVLDAVSSDKLLTALDTTWVKLEIYSEELQFPPTNLEVVSTTDTSITLSWDMEYPYCDSFVLQNYTGSTWFDRIYMIDYLREYTDNGDSVYFSPTLEPDTTYIYRLQNVYNGVRYASNTVTGTTDLNPPSLYSYWRFDEGSGSTAYDSEGSIDGTITSMNYVTGKNNTGLDVTNSDANINFGENYDFDYTDEFSISFWIKRNGSVVEHFVFSNLIAPTAKGWEVDVDSGGKLYFRMYADHSTNNKIINTDAVFTDYNWHLITICSNNNIYVDGVLNVDSITDQLTSTIKETGQTLLMGNNSELNNSGQFTYDEVGIWDKSLSAEEVNELWNNGDGKFY